MRQIVTTHLGMEYGEREKITDRVQIARVAKIGCIMNDQHSSPARDRDKILARQITFGDMFYRTIHGVTVAEDYIVFDEHNVYVDNSIYSLADNFDAKAQAVGQDYQRRLNGSIVGQDKTHWISGTAILTSNEGSGTWGHWVVHNFPRLVAVAKAIPHARVLIPAAYYGSRPNFGELLTMSGIGEDRIIKSYVDQVYHVETAVVVDYLYSKNAVHPLAMSILAEIQKSVECDGEYEPKRVLIKRTTIGKRAIANEVDFDRTMVEFGFDGRYLGGCTLRKQINAWRRSSAVASVLGSDLTNIVFGPARISITAFTPGIFGDDFFFDLAAAKGYVWNELFCGQLEEHKTPLINSSFVVDIRLLKTFLTEADIS